MKFIQQHDESDCGPACIAMVASHFKVFLRIGAIRKVACTDEKGTNLIGMVQAAESIGLKAIPVKGQETDIKPSLLVPFIAHFKKIVNGQERLHFVVVRKIYKKHILIYDPGEGKKLLSYKDFFSEWTGIVLVMSIGEDFKIKKDAGNIIFQFLPILKPHVHDLILIGIVSILLSVFGIVSSLYLKYLIDDILVTESFSALHSISIGVIILTFLRGVLTLIRSHLLMGFSLKVDNRLIFSYFKHVLGLPLSFFESRKIGEILSRIDDVQMVRNALSEAAVSTVLDTVMVIVVGAVLFMQSATLVWIVFATIPLSIFLVLMYSRLFAKAYRQLMEEKSEAHSFLVEATTGIHTVKAFNAAESMYDEYEKKQMKVVHSNYKVGKKRNALTFLNGLINGWIGNILFWVGSYLILQDTLTLGQLISFNALFGYFITPLQRLLMFQPMLQEAYVAAERLSEVFDIEPEIAESANLIKLDKFTGDIVVKDVHFKYGTRKPVLNGISFSIQKGQHVAFVGSSGCGKSTLVKLLLKFYTPESGEILFDDTNLSDIDTESLRAKIGYVPQDILLFSGTIAENIAFGRADVPLKKIIQVAEMAQAHEFIQKMPLRYNTVISERGASLSTGERQRIALARSLLGNPDLLIFDEATSSLDNVTEYEIQKTLDNLHKERITTILIAHRLTTVTNCDTIFILQDGIIVEQGNHRELLDANGYYTKMWKGIVS